MCATHAEKKILVIVIKHLSRATLPSSIRHGQAQFHGHIIVLYRALNRGTAKWHSCVSLPHRMLLEEPPFAMKYAIILEDRDFQCATPFGKLLIDIKFWATCLTVPEEISQVAQHLLHQLYHNPHFRLWNSRSTPTTPSLKAQWAAAFWRPAAALNDAHNTLKWRQSTLRISFLSSFKPFKSNQSARACIAHSTQFVPESPCFYIWGVMFKSWPVRNIFQAIPSPSFFSIRMFRFKTHFMRNLLLPF